MAKVLVLGYSDQNSKELRAQRAITVRVVGAEPLASEYVLIMDNRIPVWIGKIDKFSASAGAFPKDSRISFEQVAFLGGNWPATASFVDADRIQLDRIVELQVDQLFEMGEHLTSIEERVGNVLTVGEAAARLAWTYGVPQHQIKISIELK